MNNWKPIKTILRTILLIGIITSCSEDEPKPIEVIDLSVKIPPEKVLYKQGESLELSGLIVTLQFDNEETKDVEFISFEENGITTSSINGIEITESIVVKITHTESGKSTNQEIIVNKVSEVIIKTPPTQINYLKGEVLDFSGVEITLIRDNGDTEDIMLSEFASNSLTVSPEEGAEITEALTSLTITHVLSGKNTTQEIIINTVSNLILTAAPAVVEYYTGEYLNIAGLSITLNLDNGDTRIIERSDFETYGITTTPLDNSEIMDDNSEIIIKHEESEQTVNQSLTLLTLTDVENNTYEHVKIGEQLWMAENLKTTKYQNGDNISTTLPAMLDISNETSPQYQWAYNGDENNVAVYGRLYTQYVASDDRNVCPEGWHIPDEAEFQELVSYLINNGFNYDGSTSGNKLGKSIASTLNWNSYPYVEDVPGNNPGANNSSGFNGVGSGTRVNFDTFFTGKGVYTYWWSSDSNNDDLGIAFRIQNFQTEADIVTIGDSNTGAPCRCIRD